MTYEAWNVFLEGIKTLGLLLGGGWVLWRFQRERTHAPQIEFSVDAELHGPSEGYYAGEFILTFENKGKTRVETKNIELRVRGIKVGEPLKDWERMPPRLCFPHCFVEDAAVLPAGWTTFFEPGVTQEYKYVSRVSEDYKFLLVRAEFTYKNGDPHSAERVILVKSA